jgi:hypothetical protein
VSHPPINSIVVVTSSPPGGGLGVVGEVVAGVKTPEEVLPELPVETEVAEKDWTEFQRVK